MADSFPVGAVAGIAVAGAIVVIITVVILILVTRSRNKSIRFDPHSIDRPKSGIRGVFVNRKSRDVRKTMMLARYKRSTDRSRHSRHMGGVCLTGHTSGFVPVPLEAYSGTSHGHMDYQSVGNRGLSNHRVSKLSEVSLDLGKYRQYPTKIGNPRVSTISQIHPALYPS